MLLISSCYQLKVNCYRYKLFYVSIMVNTKQKSIVNAQTIKRKEYKHTVKENQTTTEESKGRRKEQRRTTKRARKQLTECQ